MSAAFVKGMPLGLAARRAVTWSTINHKGTKRIQIMSVVVAKPRITSPKTFLRALRGMLSSYWMNAERYQKWAYAIAGVLLASAIFHTGVLIVTNGTLEGPVSWRKPILFGEGFGLTTASVAWVISFLPKRRVIGWILIGSLGLANLFEVSWVSVQQWRGVPSHFNFSTPLDARLFALAGISIAVTATTIFLVAIWSFTPLKAPSSLAWAIRFGMIFLVLSQAVGILIIQNGLGRVTDPQTGQFISQDVGMASIFGAAGSMKIPHALTLHGIQLLPLLALQLQFSNWSESRRIQVILTATAGYSGIVAVTLWQAWSGLAPFDMTPLVGLVFSLSSALVLAAVLLTLKPLYKR